VADDFASRTDWPEILVPHRWSLERELPDGELRWTRPDKGGGVSATTGHKGRDILHNFSGNAEPFKPGENYTKFQAYALLNHGGDLSAAARALYRQGFGTRQADAATIIWPVEPSDNGDGAQQDAGQQRSDDGPRFPTLQVGLTVQCHDRKGEPNFGDVVEDRGDHAVVHWRSPDGYEASRTLHKSLLTLADGRPLSAVRSGGKSKNETDFTKLSDEDMGIIPLRQSRVGPFGGSGDTGCSLVPWR
jgi:hypothetical protein